jgi:hypothetical protein
MLDYDKPQGAAVAERIVGNALRSPEAILEALKEYEEIGLDELILDPTVSDPVRSTCTQTPPRIEHKSCISA